MNKETRFTETKIGAASSVHARWKYYIITELILHLNVFVPFSNFIIWPISVQERYTKYALHSDHKRGQWT